MKAHTAKDALSEIQASGLTLLGYSVAGEETVVIVSELDVVFDIGKCPRQALKINHVLLTHGHIDHAAGLPYYFAQRYFQDNRGGTALVPCEIVEPLEELMECWGKIDGNIPPHRIVGMKDGEQFEINRRLLVRAFTTNHVVPSLGFSVIETRNKLKNEFRGMNDKELLCLKSKGISLTTVEEIPLVAYLGDTAIPDCSLPPCVTKAKILLIECTFFRPDYSGRAQRYKHIHVSDLPRILADIESEHIIIVHVTKSIKLLEANDILRQHLNLDLLPRVSFLMNYATKPL